MILKQIITALIIAFSVLAFARAQETVQIGVTKDNTLYESNDGLLSNGSGSYLFVGKTNRGDIRRALIEFDIENTIPEGANIESVELTLNMSKTVAGNTSVTLHRVSQEWGEGTSDAPNQEGKGTDAAENDATWLHTFFDIEQWNTAGGDYETETSATMDVDNNGKYTWGSTDQLVNDVQGWVDDPSTNHGWILLGDETSNQTAKRFDSRENSTESNRPSLSVTYTGATWVDNLNANISKDYRLFDNYPNPFNSETVIPYHVAKDGVVELEIYNIHGQLVTQLVNQRQSAGAHSASWNGLDDNGQSVPSGLYYYRLQSGHFDSIGKMTLLK